MRITKIQQQTTEIQGGLPEAVQVELFFLIKAKILLMCERLKMFLELYFSATGNSHGTVGARD